MIHKWVISVLTGEKTEAQRREGTCPRSYRYLTAEPSLKSQAPDFITALMAHREALKSLKEVQSHDLATLFVRMSPLGHPRGGCRVGPLGEEGEPPTRAASEALPTLNLTVTIFIFCFPPSLAYSLPGGHPPRVYFALSSIL